MNNTDNMKRQGKLSENDPFLDHAHVPLRLDTLRTQPYVTLNALGTL